MSTKVQKKFHLRVEYRARLIRLLFGIVDILNHDAMFGLERDFIGPRLFSVFSYLWRKSGSDCLKSGPFSKVGCCDYGRFKLLDWSEYVLLSKAYEERLDCQSTSSNLDLLPF